MVALLLSLMSMGSDCALAQAEKKTGSPAWLNELPATGPSSNSLEKARSTTGRSELKGEGSSNLSPAESASNRGGQESAGGKSSKPIKLYGRIEELCEVPGAKLPVRLQALTPKLDTSRALRGQATSTNIQTQANTAYPVEWAGTWSGTLKVWTAQFDPSRWKFDSEEASQEQELLRPGTAGQVTFNFALSPSQRITLEPTQVIFSAPMDEKRVQQAMQQMQQMMGGMQGILGSGGGVLVRQMIQSVPYMYALHLGNLVAGVGVTGNMLESRTLKNNVKLLAAGTLEQQIVNYTEDRSRASGQTKYGYCETVVRFTRMSRDQLYVQAASVDYDRSGQFEDKIVLYGTVARGAPSAPSVPGMGAAGLLQNLPNMQSAPNMPNLPNLQNLQNLFNQLGQ